MRKAVVVVDDDSLIRAGLKAEFEGAGYSVVTGETIEMAAAMLSMRQCVSHVYDGYLDLGDRKVGAEKNGFVMIMPYRP